jgi:hypothetical protein
VPCEMAPVLAGFGVRRPAQSVSFSQLTLVNERPIRACNGLRGERCSAACQKKVPLSMGYV